MLTRKKKRETHKTLLALGRVWESLRKRQWFFYMVKSVKKKEFKL